MQSSNDHQRECVAELMKRMRDIVRGSLGVSARRLAVALSAASPRTDYRAVGFPLQSLTRIVVKEVLNIIR